MLYQQLLEDNKPYTASILKLKYFPLHLHHELELIFCTSGSFTVKKNGISYPVKENEFIIIESMETHEILAEDNTVGLLIEVGPAFLNDYFTHVKKLKFVSDAYSLNDGEISSFTYAAELKNLFYEIINEFNNRQLVSDLIIQGNLYKICAILIRDLPKSKERDNKNTHDISSVEKALELVYYHYNEPLSVEYAASLCGYGTSNFCKIFKNVIGKSFHTYLNQFRIKNARYLLSDTNKSIKEISQLVGFNETKTFCRVFKSFSNMTAQNYRLENRKNSDV